MKNKNIIIVGSGIAGILSARMFARENHVTLVERDNVIGGLLRSHQHEGLWFDIGAHLLGETGTSDLDDLIFGNRSKEQYIFFEYLKAGNYFKALTNNYFLDIRRIKQEHYSKACEELLVETKTEGANNLQDQLIAQFGPTLTNNVFSPVMFKFFGLDLKDLAPDSHIIFGLKRVIAFDPQQTRELKKKPYLDDKLGFHSYTEGIPSGRAFYPRENGVGDWINYLEGQLKNDGVTIALKSNITAIQSSGDMIQSTSLDDGSELDCDHLIWTVPSFLLLKAARIPIERKLHPPKMVSTVVIDYIVDKPYLSDLHYFYCFDPDYSTFRVTLYHNFNGVQDTGRHGVTCEALVSGNVNLQELEDTMFDELKLMGIISKTTQLTYSKGRIIGGGFPAPTLMLKEQTHYVNHFAANRFDNLNLLGKAAGKSFFMSDVLLETFETVNTILVSYQ